MKNVILIAAVAIAFSSCSTCYECSEEVVLYSGNTPTDTTTASEEFCTADPSEVDEREAAGATCTSN